MAEKTGLKAKFKMGTTVAQVASITPPGPVRDTVEVDDLNPTNDIKRKLLGLIDLGDCSVTLNFARGTAGHNDLEAAVYSGDLKSFEIEYPDSAKQTFSGYVTSFAIQEISAGSVIQAEVTIAVTTKPVWA